MRAIEGACGATGAGPGPIVGSSNIWARSEGSGGGAASCAVGAVVGSAANGAACVGGNACVGVFPGSGPESSEEREEVALAEEVALLAFPCHQSANPAHGTPAGVPETAITGPRGADEIKRPGELLDEAVGATEPQNALLLAQDAGADSG